MIKKRTHKRKQNFLYSQKLCTRHKYINAFAFVKAQIIKKHQGKSTEKSLSMLNRIARANTELAKSGQKCISSFFTGRE